MTLPPDSPWTHDDLALLTQAELGDSEVLLDPATPVTHARAAAAGVTPLDTHIACHFSGVIMRPTPSDVAEDVGLELSVATAPERICAVRSRAGHPLRVVSPVGGADARVDPHDDATAYVMASPGSWACVLEGDRALGVALGGRVDGLVIRALFPRPLDPPGIPALVPAAPEAWEGLEPPWLAGHARALLARGDTWSHAVAVGLCHRLSEVGVPPDAWVQGALDGSGPGGWGWAIPWAQGQPPDAIAALELMAIGEAGRLLDSITSLDDALDGAGDDASRWTSSLALALEARDDLECILALLAFAGAGGQARAAVALTDARGRDLAEVTPGALWPATDRLRRVAAVDELAWWGAWEEVP